MGSSTDGEECRTNPSWSRRRSATKSGVRDSSLASKASRLDPSWSSVPPSATSSCTARSARSIRSKAAVNTSSRSRARFCVVTTTVDRAWWRLSKTKLNTATTAATFTKSPPSTTSLSKVSRPGGLPSRASRWVVELGSPIGSPVYIGRRADWRQAERTFEAMPSAGLLRRGHLSPGVGRPGRTKGL